MARNAEKAMTTLARWRAAQVQEAGGHRERRPYLASECTDLPQAEKWRLQIVREIAKKVAQIQNAKLSSIVKMDQEVTDIAKSLSAQSMKSPNLSRNSPELLTVPSPAIKQMSPKLSPKVQSQITSPSPISLTQTYPISPPRGSINISLKSDKSRKSDKMKRDILQQDEAGNLVRSAKNSFGKPERKEDMSEQKVATEVVEILPNTLNGLESPALHHNINKIADISKILSNEANALRKSIKSLSEDVVRTKQELSIVKEDVNFPYHLFLIEIIINKIFTKCDCFELDCNNLVIAVTFLGKQPIILYDSSYGNIDDFNHINVGKSTLFAMTYDKICNIKEFIVNLQLTKQPPCSSCVTKLAECKVNYTKEFLELREELCKKWTKEQPNDAILCTTSTPLNKNMFYLLCGEDHGESIGIIELSTRMSFLGKEITTAFSTRCKGKCTSALTKEDNGMTMYSCQSVEMNEDGKILLDENTLAKKEVPRSTHTMSTRRSESPVSQYSVGRGSVKQYMNKVHINNNIDRDIGSKYDEIFTKMNLNELKIRVPKTTKLERTAKYDKIQELCSCEDSPYNNREQIQFDLPSDLCYSDPDRNACTTNLKYSYNNYKRNYENKNRKIINITPSNCPVPVDMAKQVHPQRDVFILKIGKKLETKDKRTDLEIELVTPKAPSSKSIDNNHISQQCSSSTIKEKAKNSNKKSKKKLKKSTSNVTKKKPKNMGKGAKIKKDKRLK